MSPQKEVKTTPWVRQYGVDGLNCPLRAYSHDHDTALSTSQLEQLAIRNRCKIQYTPTLNNMPSPLVALVTAGSAGLGAATARLFAQNGMRVVVNFSSNQARAEALVHELEQLSPLPRDGSNFKFIKADLAARNDIIRLVEESVSAMGQLDVVFSNGGWTKIRDINNLDDNMIEEDWDRCFNMNVKSHLFLMHAARAHLDKTHGCFITTASLAGVTLSGSSLVRRKSCCPS